MRKTKKFAKGGGAEAKRDRRMADIESDYNRAIARGQSEKEARAKRAQREADARDDYAKRTGGDRTQTRAAERAAEQRLSATRRSPDKDMKPVSVASEASKPAMTRVDTTAKADTPKVGGTSSGSQTFSQAFAAARKEGKKTFTWNGKPYTTAMRGESKPAPKPSATTPKAAPKPAVPAPKPAAPASKPPSAGKQMIQSSARRQQAQIDELGATASKVGSAISQFFAGKNRDKPKTYAKGGKVDGIAVRGKTKIRKGK